LPYFCTASSVNPSSFLNKFFHTMPPGSPKGNGKRCGSAPWHEGQRAAGKPSGHRGTHSSPLLSSQESVYKVGPAEQQERRKLAKLCENEPAVQEALRETADSKASSGKAGRRSASNVVGRQAVDEVQQPSSVPAVSRQGVAQDPLTWQSAGKIDDPRQKASKLDVIAFYYPGRLEPCDNHCRAHCLGNFFTIEQGMSFEGERFQNAEAAYQSSKFAAKDARLFSSMSGDDAYNKSRLLGHHADHSHGRFESNWNAMLHVLRAKFHKRQRADLAHFLESTGDAFLMEHNSVVGRDATWSNNGDGNGANWLGLQLMIVRDELRGECNWKRHFDERTWETAPNWQRAVKSATQIVKAKLPRSTSVHDARRAGDSPPEYGRHAQKHVQSSQSDDRFKTSSSDIGNHHVKKP